MSRGDEEKVDGIGSEVPVLGFPPMAGCHLQAFSDREEQEEAGEGEDETTDGGQPLDETVGDRVGRPEESLEAVARAFDLGAVLGHEVLAGGLGRS